MSAFRVGHGLTLPPVLSSRQARAGRAWYEIHLDRLHHAEQMAGHEPEARAAAAEDRIILAGLAGLLAQGLCPNCKREQPTSNGVTISLFGITLGRCCQPCTNEIRSTQGDVA